MIEQKHDIMDWIMYVFYISNISINPLALNVTVFGSGIYKKDIMIIQWGVLIK